MCTCDPSEFLVFGVQSHVDRSIFVDYRAGTWGPDAGTRVVQQLRGSDAGPLAAWPSRDALDADDAFEIECVSSQREACEAVDFWRACFRSYGAEVVAPAHLGE